MRAKVKLLVLLTTVVAVSGSLTLAPSTAEATVQLGPTTSAECPNTSCHAAPYCHFDVMWACYLYAGGCDGNEPCEPN